MKFFLSIAAVVFLALFPAACFTIRDKAEPIKETKPVTEEKKAEPEAPPAEPEKEAAAEPEKPAEAPQTPLAGGKTLHLVIIEENTLKLNPPKITIHAGDTIRWQNKDNKKHFLASVPGSGSTDQLEIFSLMEPGIVYEHTFKTAGEYPYFCFIHNQMTGQITVAK